MLDAIIFDMDGLMLDSEPVYRRAAQRALGELGFELTDADYLELIGLSESETEDRLAARFGSGFEAQAFRERWPAYWTESVRAGDIERKPGLDALLEHLEHTGLPRAVATSSDAERAGLSLACTGLADCFDAIVTCDQVARGKPAPDLYLAAADRLGVAPGSCLAFEDSEPGMRAALAAGIPVVVIPDLKAPTTEVLASAYRVLEDLHAAPAVVDALMARD